MSIMPDKFVSELCKRTFTMGQHTNWPYFAGKCERSLGNCLTKTFCAVRWGLLAFSRKVFSDKTLQTIVHWTNFVTSMKWRIFLRKVCLIFFLLVFHVLWDTKSVLFLPGCDAPIRMVYSFGRLCMFVFSIVAPQLHNRF